MNCKLPVLPVIRTMLLLAAGSATADGMLTGNIRIASAALGYELQYRVYLPEGHAGRTDLPVLFLTDGQDYLSRGRVPHILDKLIGKARIEPVIAVFVDARDPDMPATNRRTDQFLCNADYLKFYTDELIPAIERDYPVADNRAGRTVMGFSFGATNAACFGLLGSAYFSGLAMQSPANHPLPKLLPAYAELPVLPLRIYLSTGKPDDNTRANRRFHTLLKDKGYDLEYVEVRQGHNWKNWRSLIDNILLYFYGT